MSDDLWLKELAQVKRDREAEERSRLDGRWDRLSAGELSPEEEAELRALAETSGEARDAYEAFRPLGPGFEAGVVQAIRQQGLPQQAETPAAEPPAKLLPFRRSTSQTFRRAVWSAIAAVAATVLYFLIQPPYPHLPVYALEPVAGDQQFRGGTEPAAGVPVFSPGSTLTLNAFPDQDVNGPIDAQAFAGRGEELVPLGPQPKIERGAVLLRGTLGQEIQLSPGDWTIWVVVGRPGKIPSVQELKAEVSAGRTRHEDWQAISGEIRVEERQASP